MIKYDTTRKLWVDTENPEWSHDHDEKFQTFPYDVDFPETFESVTKFYDWRNGHKLKYTSIGMICVTTKTEEGETIPFYYQINLHPRITTDEFSWGVRIAYKFKYWYEAHQYAEQIDAYMDAVFQNSEEELINQINLCHDTIDKLHAEVREMRALLLAEFEYNSPLNELPPGEHASRMKAALTQARIEREKEGNGSRT